MMNRSRRVLTVSARNYMKNQNKVIRRSLLLGFLGGSLITGTTFYMRMEKAHNKCRYYHKK
jgi:hypothetical protein